MKQQSRKREVLRKSKKFESGATFVRSVARALKVISSFGAETPSQTLSQVAAQTNLDRATARRVLLTLEKLHYLRREDRLFSLTPLVLELGFAYLSSLPFWSIANEVLKELADSLQVFCLIVTTDRDYDHVTVVSSIRPSNSAMTFVAIPDVGRRAPTHTIAPGIVLLGGLTGKELELALKTTLGHRKTDLKSLKDRVIADRERGWSLRSVPEENFSEVAVPLLDRQGRVIASMSVLSPLSRVSEEELVRNNLPRIRQAADEINRLVALKAAQ